MSDEVRWLRILVSSTPVTREQSAKTWIQTWRNTHHNGTVVEAPPPSEWPFRYPLVPELPAGPVLINTIDLHEAFVNHQTGSTRLVTTQPMFLCESWSQALREHGDSSLIATADLETLRQHAPEVLARRGPFADAVIDLDASAAEAPAPLAPLGPGTLGTNPGTLWHLAPLAPLIAAFRASDPAARLALCIEALEAGRTAPALVATASACMEVNDLDAAARDLDEALSLAPDWAAAQFERGKLWLRADNMPRASESFRAATRILPGFGAAWANLGGTLGELDRTTEALEAFEHALACDPTSHQALNNLGVVRRELGRLTESEAAFRDVIRLVPELAFGYYNLGHTLFLQGRYRAALSAYAEGQARDPEKNPVQATRLAMCKVATGDAPGALRELQQATASLPKEYRQQLLADTSAILWALITQQPDLMGWQPVHAWMTSELERR